MSPGVCPVCGLPAELCICSQIKKEEEKIRVFVEKRRFGKTTTIIEGVADNRKKIASFLKSKLACGGTHKNDRIELQGDHRQKIKELLVELGYREEQIEVI